MSRKRSSAALDTINHYNAVRLRVTGSGNLLMTLYGPEEIKSEELVAIEMSPTEDKTRTKLANFKHERAQLEIQTDGLDEYFEIGYIIVFVKPIASGYPQN